MDPLFPIGSVCRLFGITPDTLRHYEKKGLLTPVTDPHSRYRYYTPDHLDRIEGILHARAMGIPLAQLGQTMDQESPAAYEALLAAQRQTLQERILALEEVLRQTDRRLATLRELQALPDAIHRASLPQQSSRQDRRKGEAGSATAANKPHATRKSSRPPPIPHISSVSP